jgi:hypothetical protein
MTKQPDRSRVSQGVPDGGQYRAERKTKTTKTPAHYSQPSGAVIGKTSPWGKIQQVEPIAPGIDEVVATRHRGGIKLSRERSAAIPKEFRRKSGWYGKDHEDAIVMMIFADDIGTDQDRKNEAEDAVIQRFPYEYEAFTGEVIPPGKSRVKDEDAFYEEHSNDWIVIKTYPMSISRGQPMSVQARRGGVRGTGASNAVKSFEVYLEEYNQQKGDFGFVIDETRHSINRPEQ